MIYGSSSDPGYELPSTVTNALNQTTTAQYDMRFGLPVSVTSINNQTANFAYDGFGRPTLATLNDQSQIAISYGWCSGVNGGSLSCPTNAVYAVSTTHTGADGSTALEPPHTAYYDGLDRIIVDASVGFNGETIWTLHSYNSQLLPAAVSRPYFPSKQSPANTTYTYDQIGRLIQTNYPNSSYDTIAYGGVGRAVMSGVTSSFSGEYHYTEVDADGNLDLAIQKVTQAGTLTSIFTGYLYDGFDDRKFVNDTNGGTTSYSYDVLGRVAATGDPDAGNRTMGYNAFGDPVWITDARGVTSWTNYDALARPVSRCFSSGQTGNEEYTCPHASTNPNVETLMTWSYDRTNGIGALAGETSTHGIGTTTNIYYNSLGQASSRALTVGAASYNYTYGYDANHRLTSMTTPSGATHGFQLGTNGYMFALADLSANKNLWLANTMDAELHVVNLTLGNGTYTQTQYRIQDGLPSSLITYRYNGSSAYIQNLSYAWDQHANLTSRSDNKNSVSETYSYDELDRLTLTKLGSSTEASFAYDLLGNMTTKSDIDTYTYPATGSAHPHGVSSIAHNGGGTTNLSYDGDGQITAEAGTINRTIAWTLFNQPASVTYAGKTLSFQYDADGNRIVQTSSDGTTTYLPDGEAFVAAGQSVITWHSYYVANGQRVAESYGTSGSLGHHYFHNDPQGSVLVVTDDTFSASTGTPILQNLGYDTYGQPRNANTAPDPNWGSNAVTKRGYINQEQLTSAHLIDLNARLYDPAIARFISPDPIIHDPANSQAWNAYSYANNNPTSGEDPTGLDTGSLIEGPCGCGTNYIKVNQDGTSNQGGSSSGGRYQQGPTYITPTGNDSEDVLVTASRKPEFGSGSAGASEWGGNNGLESGEKSRTPDPSQSVPPDPERSQVFENRGGKMQGDPGRTSRPDGSKNPDKKFTPAPEPGWRIFQDPTTGTKISKKWPQDGRLGGDGSGVHKNSNYPDGTKVNPKGDQSKFIAGTLLMMGVGICAIAEPCGAAAVAAFGASGFSTVLP